MQSTLSLTLDLTQKKGFFTDTTDYSAISVDVNALGATGSVAIYFQGDSIGSPLTIDLAGGDTTTSLFDLELDLNGNVANGSYSAVYTVDFAFSNFTALSAPNQIVLASIGTNYQGFTVGAEIEVSVDLPGGALITGASNISGNLYVTIDQSVSATLGSLRAVNVSQVFSGFSWVYSGCTQTTAGVEFTYDCEFENSGSWAVSNTTVLSANEFITSQVCTINYPSWTNVDPIFNPQVVTTSLPYPTILGEDTPLATGTYSVLLSQQIQQNQASGLIITYSNSITREFTVSCAGTLCGLVPCIENLRAAHAAELVRNRISKYQVFVDNVLLYYTEAMNYRACGELDSYKSTIALLQAQLDASGCDCACCDNETYYWVSNNSANSIIDELLANFQYRLFDTGMGDPGSAQAGVEYGAIWQNTNTGVLYRCIDDTPSSLDWEVYYDPSDIINASEVVATATAPLTSLDVQGQLNEIATNAIFGATNGLTESGDDVKLGGTLTEATTINRGANNLTISGTTSSVSITGSDTLPSLSVSNSTGRAFNSQGVHSVGSGVFNTLDLIGTNTASPTLLLAGVSLAPGNGHGTSLRFSANEPTASYTGYMSSIISTWENASAKNSKLDITTTLAGVESTALTINPDASVTLPLYGTGTITGTPEYSLSVDSAGNIVETASKKVYVALLTQSGTGNPTVVDCENTTGETITWTRNGEGTYNASITNSIFTSKTAVNVSYGGIAPVGGYDGIPICVTGQRLTSSIVQLKTYGAPIKIGVLQDPEIDDSLLYNATVRIEIY